MSINQATGGREGDGMKKGDLILNSRSGLYAVVWAVPYSGGVTLLMVPLQGSATYLNNEVYSVDLLAHFGWRVMEEVGVTL